MSPTTRLAAAGAVAVLFGCAHLETRPVDRSTPRAEPEPRDQAPQWTPQERTAAAMVAIERKQEKLQTRGPKTFDAPQEAHDFFMQQRLGPGQPEYPFEHLRATLAEIQARELAEQGPMPTWSWLGPGNRGGRTRAFVIDPTDPDIMYAGGVAGGIWKSTDGGASWNPADDLLLNLAVASLAIDPTNPSVLYAGTLGSRGDSEIAVAEPRFVSVISGEIARRSLPRSRDRKT